MTPVFGLCEDYVTRWAALDPVAAGISGITAAFGAGSDYGPDGVAISYKLGERGWLAAREEAMRQPGFDLRRWRTAALSLGPVGLADLAAALRAQDGR
jgi:Bacterial protein of unknown function (DUF885)